MSNAYGSRSTVKILSYIIITHTVAMTTGLRDYLLWLLKWKVLNAFEKEAD